MARVTVEDCVGNIGNRFDMVLSAARRARQIYAGDEPMVERENDKPTVIALREIAEGHVTKDVLEQPENLRGEEELVMDLKESSSFVS